MANHKSAVKRAKQNETRRIRNKSVRTAMKTDIKKVLAAKDAGTDDTTELLNKAKSSIARAAKKGVLHKNTAARKTSRITKYILK
ncbi:MAG: 30S ribosomal protein S20 [Thermodesulfobacteriota bacterium]|nr:30S ribosomal protein S20 [Thermodesulfobacteriota bacterium]